MELSCDVILAVQDKLLLFVCDGSLNILFESTSHSSFHLLIIAQPVQGVSAIDWDGEICKTLNTSIAFILAQLNANNMNIINRACNHLKNVLHVT